jgi:hypothetical protein
MTVKARVVEKAVDRSEVVPLVPLISCVYHRTDYTLPKRLTGRESKNRSSVTIQAPYEPDPAVRISAQKNEF